MPPALWSTRHAPQALLPLNPAGCRPSPDLSFNTAVSFATNTNWQNYGGESTMSYLAQMVGLPLRTSSRPPPASPCRRADPRLCAASAKTVGNFWVDLTRCTLYVLLPLSIVAALVLVWQGVPQTSAPMSMRRRSKAPSRRSPGPGGLADRHQAARHQWRRLLERELRRSFRDPTPLTDFVEAVYILVICAALTHTFGRMVKDTRQGWRSSPSCRCCSWPVSRLTTGPKAPGNPPFAALGIEPGNMEGKEVRFGVANSRLWAVATTDASNGTVNAMHDSFTPLGGMIPSSISNWARSFLAASAQGSTACCCWSSSPCSWRG